MTNWREITVMECCFEDLLRLGHYLENHGAWATMIDECSKQYTREDIALALVSAIDSNPADISFNAEDVLTHFWQQ